MTKVLETDIKSLVLNELKTKNLLQKGSLVMNEYTIGNFSRRADLVVTTKNKMYSFEIKSASDSLNRLEGQVSKYQEYFDKVIVVADPKFIPKILDLVPNEIGVWEASSNNLSIKRRGVQSAKVDNSKLIDHMDVADLSKIATFLNIDCKKDRNSLVKCLSNAPNKLLRAKVFETFERKFGNISERLWNATLDSPIESHHISKLSRFREAKQREEQQKVQSQMFWENFEKHLQRLQDFAVEYANSTNQPNRLQCQSHH